MPTILRDIYKQNTNELRNFKTEKDEVQVISKFLIKMIHFLSYDAYKNNIDMDFIKWSWSYSTLQTICNE